MSIKTRVKNLEHKIEPDKHYVVSVLDGETSDEVIERYCQEHNINESDRERALWVVVNRKRYPRTEDA